MKTLRCLGLVAIVGCTTSPRSGSQTPAAPDTAAVDSAKGEHHEHGEKEKGKQHGHEKEKDKDDH